ncbi:MAG: hypothetical protein LQ347_002787 [Umbilicaria vellea]|nr:MAG: hypothetical protein LQ347_002787 [Umbilicaria vellea]
MPQAIIGSGHKAALLEAFCAVVALLPQNLRNDLVLIGGTALLSLGGNRKTVDVDMAVTAPALHAFYAAAAYDPRFRKGSMEDWEYTSSGGIVVPLEFLTQGGAFAPIVRAAREILGGGGMRAGLGELAVMKAKTWLMRDEGHDLEDFKFLLVKMRETRESFGELQPGDSEEIGDEEALVSAAEDVETPLKAMLLNMLGL